jgi:hypothetical protein
MEDIDDDGAWKLFEDMESEMEFLLNKGVENGHIS